MKNLTLVFALALFSNVLSAHGNYYGSNQNSDLNIKMWDNSSFIITIDHSQARKTRNFNLKNIEPGNHFVKIVKRTKNSYHYGHNNGGFVQTIFKGNIKIPAKRNVFVSVAGKNCLKFKFLKKPTHNHLNNGHGHDSHQNHYNHHANGYNSGGYNSSNHYNNWNQGCESINNYGGYYGQSNFGNNGFENNYGPVVMSDNSFNCLMDILKKEHFDNDRLGIAKQALATNSMNVSQVSAIMDQFTFDDSKLVFAKSAYHKTIDRENYFVINGKFTFSSSVSDLNNFIKHFGFKF